jgi:hypothetical protein
MGRIFIVDEPYPEPGPEELDYVERKRGEGDENCHPKGISIPIYKLRDTTDYPFFSNSL